MSSTSRISALFYFQPGYHVATGFRLDSYINRFSIYCFICSWLFLAFFHNYWCCGFGAFIGLIAAASYRLDRIKSYIDPWNDPLGTGFQGIQSLFAIAPGGLFGHGYGNSRQKYLYLPEPQNDFIFSIIAEESGFLGATIILLLFIVLLVATFGIAIRSKGPFSFLSCNGDGVNDSLPNLFKYRCSLGFVTCHGCNAAIYQLWWLIPNDDLDSSRNRHAFYE